MLARFNLTDNSIDSKTILDKIITMGIPRTHVTRIRRFRSGQVDVTFGKRESLELFLSKVATTFELRPPAPRPTWQSGIFVTVQDAPWELPDDLMKQRLQKYGSVYSIRRAVNQSLFPEKVPDGRRVLRMVVRRPIPPFTKFGPFLVRVFYRSCQEYVGSATLPIISGESAQRIIVLIAIRRGTSPMLVTNASSALSVNQKSTWLSTAPGTGVDGRWLKELNTEKKILRRHTQQTRI